MPDFARLGRLRLRATAIAVRPEAQRVGDGAVHPLVGIHAH